jgi:hypothetical protein
MTFKDKKNIPNLLEHKEYRYFSNEFENTLKKFLPNN